MTATLRLASNQPARRAPARRAVALSAADRRTVNNAMHAVAGGFAPAASYYLAHVEAPATAGWHSALLWAAVAACLIYSAPTLAQWARNGLARGSAVKSWGFAALLETVMTASWSDPLSLTGLAILAAINAYAGWTAPKRGGHSR